MERIRVPILPLIEEWDWQMKANCRGKDPDIFFHPDGERGRARTRREHLAKDICRACEVLMQCRSYAESRPEPYGTWGGASENERDGSESQRTRRRRHGKV